MKYFEGLMQKNHGGWFTQEAAEALTTRDRNVQRKVQKLEILDDGEGLEWKILETGRFRSWRASKMTAASKDWF